MTPRADTTANGIRSWQESGNKNVFLLCSSSSFFNCGYSWTCNWVPRYTIVMRTPSDRYLRTPRISPWTYTLVAVFWGAYPRVWAYTRGGGAYTRWLQKCKKFHTFFSPFPVNLPDLSATRAYTRGDLFSEFYGMLNAWLPWGDTKLILRFTGELWNELGSVGRVKMKRKK